MWAEPRQCNLNLVYRVTFIVNSFWFEFCHRNLFMTRPNILATEKVDFEKKRYYDINIRIRMTEI